jgi:radical SAM protein with 4Fe4S-binding SPASM domain
MSESWNCREEDFGGLLFDKNAGALMRLNVTGLFLCKCLESNGETTEGLIQRIASQFGPISTSSRSAIEKYIASLVARGIITEMACATPDAPASCQRGEEEVMPPTSAQAMTLRAPIFVWWDITNACNFHCKQCYSKSGRRLSDELTLDEVKAVITDLAAMKVFFIYFLGGEPFMRPDFLNIVEHSLGVGMRVMVNTNGWFVSEDVAKRLADLGVQHVRVSMDGATPDTHDSIRGVEGAFTRAVLAVKNLKSAGIRTVGVTPTMMNENFHEAQGIVNLAVELGADEIQLGQLCHVGRGESAAGLSVSQINSLREIVSESARLLRNRLHVSSPEGTWNEKPFLNCVKHGRLLPDIMGCGGGRSAVAISATGKVRCCLLNDLQVGDVREQSFKDIWFGAASQNMHWLRSTKEGCCGCKYTNICSGPCPIERISTADERRTFVSDTCGLEEGACKLS